MRCFMFILLFCTIVFACKAEQYPTATPSLAVNKFQPFFESAYQAHTSIPKGVLEAVAFTNSHFNHITHAPGDPESCVGMPKYYGVMGLVADGKNYFRANLPLVSQLSGYSAEDIIFSPEKNILAYARAYEQAQKSLLPDARIKDHIPVLVFLSELPDTGVLGINYAMNTHLYSVLTFLNNAQYAKAYNFPQYNIDLLEVFGAENLNVLSAGHVVISESSISDENGNTFKGSNHPVFMSPDYSPANWTPAPSCNYTFGRTQPVSAITIHDVEGSYAGCISWFQNCASNASAHYVVRSSDGQVTQMVLESNKAFHVGSQNPYTIGIEHEGYSNQTGWYTTAMYNASAALCADICAGSYGIDALRTGFQPWMSTTYYNQSGTPGSCVKIKGHQHYPGQTHVDPGPNWDWNYFYKKINPQPVATVYTTATGSIYDSGGSSGNYSDDERLVWTISPSAATSVTLNFTSFNTENSWDYLYVYNGTSVWAPLIGYYTGSTNPGTLVANSGSITLEFRSDCSGPAGGWSATWASNATTIVPTNLAVAEVGCPSIQVNLNWQNSGSNWVMNVSDDAGFSHFWELAVPNLTTVSCPGGFQHNSIPGNYLAFQPNTTYYWRIWDGTSYTSGSPFTTPNCAYMNITCSGSFDDTGGPSSSYSGNEDWVTIIQPGNGSSVTLNFTSFDLETNYDSLWIYDSLPGTNLIGIYTGTISPGTVTANSGMMSVRFKSDPFVNNAGWTATWNCTVVTGIYEQDGSGRTFVYPNPFKTIATLEIPGHQASVFEFKMYDVFGREVMRLSGTGQRLDIVRGTLPGGMYFYEVQSGQNVITKGKIIAE